MTQQRGLLIALEGIDGAGKSTLHRTLAAALRRRGFSVRRRHEPSDPRLGSLAQRASVEDAWTGAVYFTVDRHQAREQLARDLSRFDIVLTDRSFFSTLAYQGSALPPAERRRLEALQRTATVVPDRVVLLDLPPRVALRRLGGRARERGPLERLRTLERVARAYRHLARREGWVVLDSTRPARELTSRAVSELALGRGESVRRTSRSRGR